MPTALKGTLEDIIENPKAYGAALGINVPTFDEFRKNPDKYKTGPLSLLEVAEQGPLNFRRHLRTIRYHIGGEEVKTLEAVEQRAKDLGWDLLRMEMKPELEQVTGGRIDVHVKFVQKEQVVATQG